MSQEMAATGRLDAAADDAPDGARDRADLRRMLALIRRHGASLALATVLLTIASLLGLALPLVIRSLVDSVLVSGNLTRLNLLALGLVALFVVQGFLFAGNNYLLVRAAQEIGVDLRLQLYERLQRLPLGFFRQRRTGELVSRVTNDVTVVQDTLTQTPITLLRELITLIGGIGLMVAMNWRLSLLILVVVPPIVVAGAFFGRRLQRLSI
ncbi:MAG TPA: ABC transporter transmembrane domain-containing protein, partial [Thermomicrobiaceae bacterium]|nr:ABC transporter transmembrane domain-containing protein [Thermomicrobiaceae bacterium]